MRASSLGGLRVVLAGSVALLCSSAAAAQSGQPVQVVPITPVTRGPVTPAGPAAQTPRQPNAEQPPVAVPMTQAPLVRPVLPSSTVMLPPASDSSRKLALSFSNGRVSLTAENVTVNEILAEWAKKGGTVMDNADKLTGGPVSFAFENEPELKVLQALLRPYPGMIIVPRPPSSAIASAFARVNIVARSSATSSYVPPAAGAMPQYQQSPEDEVPPIAGMPPARIPGPERPLPPSGPTTPSTMPSAGPGSARPGVVVAPVNPTTGAPVPGQIIK